MNSLNWRMLTFFLLWIVSTDPSGFMKYNMCWQKQLSVSLVLNSFQLHRQPCFLDVCSHLQTICLFCFFFLRCTRLFMLLVKRTLTGTHASIQREGLFGWVTFCIWGWDAFTVQMFLHPFATDECLNSSTYFGSGLGGMFAPVYWGKQCSCDKNPTGHWCLKPPWST